MDKFAFMNIALVMLENMHALYATLTPRYAYYTNFILSIV